MILTKIDYWNQSKVELPVEEMVASGYGSGIGSSIMGGLQGFTGIASMAGPQGGIIGTGASLGLNAICGIGSAVGEMFGGPSQPDANDEINYACVADLQITQHNKPENFTLNAQSGASLPPGVCIKPDWRPASIKKHSMDPKRHRYYSRSSARQSQGIFNDGTEHYHD